MMLRLTLLTLLALGVIDDEIVHRGPGFSITYPKKNSKLQPPSAAVPFQLEYRKNSLLRLETERLMQPIDLSDETFADIFREVQLERLRERVGTPLESDRVRRFSWGVGVEFHYYLPARNGKKNRRDRVTEVVTTVDETLYRFTYWIPERDLKRVAAPFAQIVESFSPDRAIAEATASSETAESEAPLVGYSAARSDANAEAYRREIEEQVQDKLARAELYAELAETLGWKGYLTESPSPAELEEMHRAAEAALNDAPSDVDAHQARAWTAYHENRMVEMEEEIKKAIAIEPDNAENHLLYALWYGFNPERSEAMARLALDVDPGYAAAYYVKAAADRRSGDLVEARQALEEAVKLDPGFTEAHLQLAEVLGESGDARGALDAYRAAAAAAPNDANVSFRFARALRRAGRIDESITEYQALLRLEPSLAEVHYNLAVLFLQERQAPDLAREHFRRFVELDPESARAPRVREWLSANDSR